MLRVVSEWCDKLRAWRPVVIIRDNLLNIVKASFAITACLYGIFGNAYQFSDSDLLSKYLGTTAQKVIYPLLLYLFVVVLIGILHAFYFVWKKKYICFCTATGKKIGVYYGDILKIKDEMPELEQVNIVVNVNRCFDVRVNKDLVSSATLHGAVMGILVSIYGVEKLNGIIQKKLSDCGKEPLSRSQKPQGNMYRYAPGTVAEVAGEDKRVKYLLLALCAFDKELHAHTSDEEYHQAMLGLLHCISEASQGFPVFVPLMGTGLSRARKNPKAVKEYLLAFLRLHESKLVSDVYIVIN